MADRRYWAFLSYSHADRGQARWLHRALETWAVPRRLVGRATSFGPAPRRFSPIFRDREDLTADAHLLARVEDALERSAYLIVLCSPDAARSAWVEQEIVRFKVLHGEDRVLAVIVAGSPRASETAGHEAEECFPPALRVRVAADGALTAQRAEPLAVDLRPGQDGRRLGRLKLLARMLEVDLDDLVRRDAQRRQTQLAAAVMAMGAVAVATTALSVVALIERNEARHQRARAEGLVEFMLGDLTKKLKPTGRLDLLDAVGAEALGYYAAEAHRGLDADALGRRARVLHLLGDLRDQRGDLAGASLDFQQAARTTAKLLAAKPADGTRIFNHAQSLYYVGTIANQRGQTAQAEQAFLEYRRLALRLVDIDPRRDDWRAEVAYANENLGALWQKQNGRTDQAVAAYFQALGVQRELAAKSPGDRDRQTDLAGTYEWLSDANFHSHRWDAAERDLLAQRAIYTRLLARQPSDNGVRQQQVRAGVHLGNVYSMTDRPADAVRELSDDTRKAEDLIRLEPDDTAIRDLTSVAFTTLAKAMLATGDARGAAKAADRALALAVELARKDPSVDDWSGLALGGARVVAVKAAAAQARSVGALRRALKPSLAEADRLSVFSAARPANFQLARIAANALLLAGDYQALAGRADLARQSWARAIHICQCKVVSNGIQSRGQISTALLTQSLKDVRSLNGGAASPVLLGDVKRRWLGTDLW